MTTLTISLLPISPGSGYGATGNTSATTGKPCARLTTDRRQRIERVDTGGCNFVVRPSLKATEVPVFWSAEADTSTVLLIQAPSVLAADSNLVAVLHEGAARSDDHGVHFLHDADNQTIHVVRLAGVSADLPVAALVPLDPDGLDRIEGINRLLRALQGRPVPEDSRVTRQQRRRFRHMLQAIDGRMNGANYREIADVVFGVDRVASDPWKTSALRDATMGLVKDGFTMIAGGYRTLLRHRRRS